MAVVVETEPGMENKMEKMERNKEKMERNKEKMEVRMEARMVASRIRTMLEECKVQTTLPEGDEMSEEFQINIEITN